MYIKYLSLAKGNNSTFHFQISINKCHYLVDLDLPNYTELEPKYSQQIDDWRIVSSHLFIDTSR